MEEGVYTGPPAGLGALMVAVAVTCSCIYWAPHLCLLNVWGGSFSGLRDGEAGVGPLWGGTPDLGPLHRSASR